MLYVSEGMPGCKGATDNSLVIIESAVYDLHYLYRFLCIAAVIGYILLTLIVIRSQVQSNPNFISTSSWFLPRHRLRNDLYCVGWGIKL